MVDVVRILFPTDFSESSAAAGKYAFTLADRLEAELHALHVVEAIAPTVSEALQRIADSMDNYLEQARDGAEHALAAAWPSDLAGGKKVVRVVRTGKPLTTSISGPTPWGKAWPLSKSWMFESVVRAIEPLRVPIVRPSSGVKPVVVAAGLPPRMADAEHPLPK